MPCPVGQTSSCRRNNSTNCIFSFVQSVAPVAGQLQFWQHKALICGHRIMLSHRTVEQSIGRRPVGEEPDSIAPGYINRQPVAWYGSHRHSARGENEAYRFTYLYELIYCISPKRMPRQMTLPNNPGHVDVRSNRRPGHLTIKSMPAPPLYDELEAAYARVSADSSSFVGGRRLDEYAKPWGNRILYAGRKRTDVGITV